MNYSLIYNDVELKYRSYSKYVKKVYLSCKELLDDPRLNQHISIILINQDEMHHMNKMYRNLDRPTDVLTFVDDLDDENLGDIFINVSAMESQAKEYGHSKRREFSFLVTHGILHLLGFDHHSEKEEKEMFELQERILIHSGATR